MIPLEQRADYERLLDSMKEHLEDMKPFKGKQRALAESESSNNLSDKQKELIAFGIEAENNLPIMINALEGALGLEITDMSHWYDEPDKGIGTILVTERMDK